MIHTPEIQALIAAIDDYHPNNMTTVGAWERVLAKRKALAALEPEPPKPREWWLAPDLGHHIFSTLSSAKAYSEPSKHHLITHYREVLPDEKSIVCWPKIIARLAIPPFSTLP